MRVKAATVQKILLGSALLAGLAWNLAQASEVNGLALSNGATGTRAEIALDQEAEFKVISLQGPDRLVVDLPTSRLASNLRLPAPTGLIKSVRTGQPSPGTTRIVFDLAQPVAVLKPHLEPGATGPRLVLEWPGDGAEATNVPANLASTPAASAQGTASTPGSAVADASQPAKPDADAAASAAATTRLISEIAARSAGSPSMPANGQAGAGGTVASAPSTATPSSTTGTTTTTVANGVPVKVAGQPSIPTPPATSVTAPATTIATGVPTRIATGQPATPLSATPSGNAGVPGSTQPVPLTGAVKTMKDVRGRGMRPLVIAIDAGHGGQDSGAVGPNGNKEKDVTLAIARELARQINATPGLKAYLTRDSDFYIPLNNRAKLARSAKADIFVSIHADAAENRTAKGSSVYVLSLKGASSQRARWLADKENASDMIGGVRLEKTSNTLASVLLDLTQSGHMKASEDAANHVLDGLKRVGNNHKPGIERANFAVLRTSDMPAMLVETAFISNPDEERRLVDPSYQRTLARAVLDGVDTYFTRQPPPGTLYATKAEANYSASLGGSGGGAP